MKTYQYISATLILIAIVLISVSIFSVKEMNERAFQLQHFFATGSWQASTKMVLYVMLVISGITMLFKSANANFWLALSGHMIIEEFLFNLLGITEASIPATTMVVLLLAAGAVLYIAYSNWLKVRKLTLLEVINGLLIGTSVIYLPTLI